MAAEFCLRIIPFILIGSELVKSSLFLTKCIKCTQNQEIVSVSITCHSHVSSLKLLDVFLLNLVLVNQRKYLSSELTLYY
jgi:hypothetical protein